MTLISLIAFSAVVMMYIFFLLQADAHVVDINLCGKAVGIDLGLSKILAGAVQSDGKGVLFSEAVPGCVPMGDGIVKLGVAPRSKQVIHCSANTLNNTA